LVTKVAPTIVDDNERMPTKWTKVPPPLRRAIAEAPQSWAAVAAARRATRGDLRILAFHGVPDFKRFADLLDAVTAQYVPVSASQVERALGGEELLPPYPVWFTFDDGLPSTFAAGELLARHGVRATAFVCPGVLDTDRLLWFQVRQRCLELYLLTDEDPRFALSRLKSLNDAERRAETDVLQLRLVAAGATSPRQADQRMLETWIAQGHDIGNHTWDHPMLDQCSPEDQRDQVFRAHHALESRGISPRFLAYPNGNGSSVAGDAAAELGYGGSVLFNHKLTRLDADRNRLSRLRMDATAGRRRAASILSGAHPAAVHLLPGL